MPPSEQTHAGVEPLAAALRKSAYTFFKSVLSDESIARSCQTEASCVTQQLNAITLSWLGLALQLRHASDRLALVSIHFAWEIRSVERAPK